MNLPQHWHEDWLRPDWDAPHVRALMSTRAGGVSQGLHASLNIGLSVQDDPAAVRENRRRVAAALQGTPVFLHQVHGTEVLRLEPGMGGIETHGRPADAAISTEPGIACAVSAADCMPVLFAAPRGVGAAHAGWRGLSGGVLERTLQALCEASGCEPAEVQVWMGPCIGPEAFEVGEEVLRAFGAKPAGEGASMPHFRYRPNAAGQPRWRADLVALARERLRAAGASRLSGGAWCTYSEPSRFFSYRREPLAGRMVAAICLA